MNANTAKQNNKALTVLARIGISLLILIFGVFLLAYSVFFVICYGPSESARDLFVTTCMETSFAKYFPMMVLSQENIEEIQAKNAVVDIKESTDSSLIFSDPEQLDASQPDIEIVEVKEANYKGYMAIVKDPSRVKVATLSSFGDAGGKLLLDMINDEGAILGVNAGGFADSGGTGHGGSPLGIVIADGNFVYGSRTETSCVIGFDNNNVLHVGNMTGQEAIDKGLRDAVSFGPVLIVNGKPATITGNGGGLNPRTAIGQREDGSVLILVIDGRQPHSAGASHKDLIEVMVKFGAVNAGNLDGGSSTMMYYKGELINSCASLYGPRKLPTGIIVV